MATTTKNTAIMLLSCPGSLARKGVVAAISNFIMAHKGSILHSDDHQDSGLCLFLSRLECGTFRTSQAAPLARAH